MAPSKSWWRISTGKILHIEFAPKNSKKESLGLQQIDEVYVTLWQVQLVFNEDNLNHQIFWLQNWENIGK